MVDLDFTLDLVLSLSSSKEGSLLGPLLPLSRLWKNKQSVNDFENKVLVMQTIPRSEVIISRHNWINCVSE